jgi:hypothetical protein
MTLMLWRADCCGGKNARAFTTRSRFAAVTSSNKRAAGPSPVPVHGDNQGPKICLWHLEEALALADEIEDGQTGFLIERTLDEARLRQFRPIG